MMNRAYICYFYRIVIPGLADLSSWLPEKQKNTCFCYKIVIKLALLRNFGKILTLQDISCFRINKNRINQVVVHFKL